VPPNGSPSGGRGRYDLETGFYFLRNRYYDPAAGRLTQEDPIGYGGGGNVYAYGNGSPLTGRDPSGTRMDAEMYEGCHNCHDLDAGSYDALDYMMGGGDGWDLSALTAWDMMTMIETEADHKAYEDAANAQLKAAGIDPKDAKPLDQGDYDKLMTDLTRSTGLVQSTNFQGGPGLPAWSSALNSLVAVINGGHFVEWEREFTFGGQTIQTNCNRSMCDNPAYTGSDGSHYFAFVNPLVFLYSESRIVNMAFHEFGHMNGLSDCASAGSISTFAYARDYTGVNYAPPPGSCP